MYDKVFLNFRDTKTNTLPFLNFEQVKDDIHLCIVGMQLRYFHSRKSDILLRMHTFILQLSKNNDGGIRWHPLL